MPACAASSAGAPQGEELIRDQQHLPDLPRNCTARRRRT